MKDELGGKVIAKFAALSPETYSYLTDDDTFHKKAKGTKKCVLKWKIALRLHKVVMMIRDCKLLIRLQHMHMEQMLLLYVKERR